MAWMVTGNRHLSWLALVLAGLGGCGPVTRVPKMGPHTAADSAVEVRQLPPEPVRVEQLPPQPTEQSVWVDGFWHWTGRRWDWVDGGWEVPPEGAYYAPSRIVRIPVAVYGDADDGGARVLRGYGMTLMYLPGHWHLPDGRTVTQRRQRRRPRDR
ncbi:MAG: hypothetical protein MUF54_07570 [Polyangiaceae bacterium]|jgi:hypothetical protein|nr:hypothetical protein [Polyangiaceae bacterium]